MTGLTRRRLTKLLLVGTGVNLVAGAAMELYLLPDGRFRELVRSALFRRVGDLGFTDEDFDRFVVEYQAIHRVEREEQLLGYAWPVYRWSPLLEQAESMRTKLENWEERLITQFLLSTDYFAADRTGDPRYVTLYSPGLRPCQNPFARLRSTDG